jgi:hypothetical protein
MQLDKTSPICYLCFFKMVVCRCISASCEKKNLVFATDMLHQRPWSGSLHGENVKLKLPCTVRIHCEETTAHDQPPSPGLPRIGNDIRMQFHALFQACSGIGSTYPPYSLLPAALRGSDETERVVVCSLTSVIQVHSSIINYTESTSLFLGWEQATSLLGR